ncbi:hypothetical protein QTN25_009737 [Entamoeba marina]
MKKQVHSSLAPQELNIEALKLRLGLEDNQLGKPNNILTENRKEIFNLFMNIDKRQLLDIMYVKERIAYIRSFFQSVYLKYNKKYIWLGIATFLIHVLNKVTTTSSRLKNEETNENKPKQRMGCPLKINRDVLKRYITKNENQNPVHQTQSVLCILNYSIIK